MNNLSIVVTGRNDNYDGNFDERLAIALFHNIQSLPQAQFIFIEWNPILDKPLVCEKLKKLFGNRIDYYVVDPKYHEQYCTCDWFIEYPAKNIGIRKSTKEYILCTNSDIIFSPDMVNNLRNQPLARNTIYRATRVDIPMGNTSVKFPLKPEDKLGVNKGPMNAAGDFLLLHRDTWHQLTGYCEEFPQQRLHKDAFAIHILMNKFKFPVVDLGMITHWRHPSSWSNSHQRPRVGDPRWDFNRCGFQKNKDTWGLTFTRETEIEGIKWLT